MYSRSVAWRPACQRRRARTLVAAGERLTGCLTAIGRLSAPYGAAGAAAPGAGRGGLRRAPAVRSRRSETNGQRLRSDHERAFELARGWGVCPGTIDIRK